jgi:hypothetical protein
VFHPETPKSCPPNNATNSNGIYYRFIFNNPPTAEDFVIWALESGNRHQLLQKKRDCKAFAVSMIAEEGIKRKFELFSRPMKIKAQKKGATFLGIAAVKIDKDSGVIKQTGKDFHYDFWPYITCKLENSVLSVRGI